MPRRKPLLCKGVNEKTVVTDLHIALKDADPTHCHSRRNCPKAIRLGVPTSAYLLPSLPADGKDLDATYLVLLLG